MTGVIYCRVSSKEQIEGTSLDVQEAACRDYARSQGIKIVRVFVEQGESAKVADRTQLIELLNFCRDNKGRVEVLLVWKVDRFARNVADHFGVKATLGKYGVHIVSVTEPIDNNPEGKLMETILAGFAQFDNDIRTMRTVQGMRRKLQEGIFPWGPPFGYKSSVVSGEKKNRPDLPEQPTFGLVQRAWKVFGTGAYTQADMGRLMQSWGLTTANGQAFAPQSLHQLFTNPYYAGILVDPWSGAEYNGRHVAMVTREDFARVQAAVTRRDQSTPHQKDSSEFPLRGLVRCGACHHYFTGAFSRGRSRSYPYYVCHAALCPKRNKSVPAAEIHDEFNAFLDVLTPKSESIEELSDLIIQSAATREAEAKDRSAQHRTQIAQLDRELQELIRMRAQELITDQEFLQQKKRLSDQRASQENRDRNIVRVGEVRQHLQETLAPLGKLRETWRQLKPPFRKRFDRLLLPGGFVMGQSRTAQTGLLFSTIEASALDDSLVVPFTYEKLNRLIVEIQSFWEVLNGIEEPKPEPKRHFENSHRNRLRWPGLNRGGELKAA